MKENEGGKGGGEKRGEGGKDGKKNPKILHHSLVDVLEADGAGDTELQSALWV